MRNIPDNITAVLLLAFLLVPAGIALCDSQFPNPVGFVNDHAGVLGDDERIALENLCREVKQKARIEIAIVIMSEIPGGQAVGSYAVDLGHHWGVGGKSDDRGAVIFYKTGKPGERDVYIATGYGLEGDITDAGAGRIRDQVLIPYLSEGRHFEAFATTISTIVNLVEPEVRLTGAPAPREIQVPSGYGKGIYGLIVMFLIIMSFFGPRGSRGMLLALVLGSALGRRSYWGTGGGGFSGGFGGFGGGGGGFGGFGGGGFGGGGAGGSF